MHTNAITAEFGMLFVIMGITVLLMGDKYTLLGGVKYHITLLIFNFSILLLAACSPKDEQAVTYWYRQEKTEIVASESTYKDFSGVYGRLYDQHTDSIGDVYFLYCNEEQQVREYHVIHYSQNSGRYEELPMHPDNTPAICFIRSAPGDTVILYDTLKAYFYRPDSDTPYAEAPAWPKGGILFTDDGAVICQTYSNSPYYIFDMTTGDKTGTFLEADFLFEAGKYQPFLDGEYGRELLMTGAGIYEHMDGTWVLQVPAQRTSLSSPGFSAVEIGNDEEGIYICDSVYQYRFFMEEVVEEIPSVTLKITAWQDRYTIKAALAEYQISHPEVTIEYDFLCMEEPGNAQEMNTLIQELNVEITSAQASDIYILDDQLWNIHQKNGYLMDLTDILQPYAAKDDYFGNAMKAYAAEDGIFVIPWFFTAQFAVCTQELVPYVNDIHSLAAYLEANPEEPGLIPYYYRNRPNIFLATMYDFYIQDLSENGMITKESVEYFLASARIIYERQQENPSATLPGYPLTYSSIAEAPSLDTLYLLMEKKEGNISLSPCTAIGVSYITQAFHHPGYTAIPVGGLKSKSLLGIHTESKEKESAAQLLAYLIEYFEESGKGDQSIKTFGFLPGLPIYKGSLQDALLPPNNSPEAKQCWYFSLSEGEYPIYYTTLQESQKITSLLDEFKQPGSTANALSNYEYAIFIERSQGYLSGERSLQDVAADIYDGLSLLYEEGK